MNRGGGCEIKICGVGGPEEAAACAEMGAHAIGLVFFAKSPRCIRPDAAWRIRQALPERVQTIGVFVNESAETILDIAEKGGLTGVQLHGRETPELVRELRARGLLVIKALYMKGTPAAENAGAYGADACLIECARGELPGGNAMAWNWAEAADVGKSAPFVLAGGLSAETVAEAIASARPDAVDVSSAVEAAPGKKDLNKVQAFIQAVHQSSYHHPTRRIFNADGPYKQA